MREQIRLTQQQRIDSQSEGGGSKSDKGRSDPALLIR